MRFDFLIELARNDHRACAVAAACRDADFPARVDLAELAGYPAEIEFISDGGELKECVLWFGPLRTAPSLRFCPGRTRSWPTRRRFQL